MREAASRVAQSQAARWPRPIRRARVQRGHSDGNHRAERSGAYDLTTKRRRATDGAVLEVAAESQRGELVVKVAALALTHRHGMALGVAIATLP